MSQICVSALARRALLLSFWAAVAVVCLGGCAAQRPSVTMVQKVDPPLGDDSLSLNFIYQAPLGVLSPHRRYAKMLRPRLHNRLLEEGFVLQRETAQRHLVVDLVDVTTGGSGGKFVCELHVVLYGEWPGDLEELKKEKKEFPPSPPAQMELDVRSEKSGAPMYGKREQYAKEAAYDAVEALVRALSKMRESSGSTGAVPENQ